MSLLSVQDVHVHFKKRNGFFEKPATIQAVNGVSLEIAKGEILGLVGESGCGKSTLSRAIMQLQPITQGNIILEGTDLTKLSKSEIRKRRLDFQMVFQDPYASLNPRLTIYSTLLEALQQRREIPKSERADAITALMERVGLNPEYAQKYPHEFSGGQRQRIAIARALAPEPKLIIADEPVSALDVSIQSQILNLLLELRKELDLTMIFISHDLSVVQFLADNIAVMQAGTLQEYGTAEDVFYKPQAEYTKTLLSAIPHLPAAPKPKAERLAAK